MNFVSIINAQMQLSCNETTIPISPSTPHIISIEAKGTNNQKHVVFIGSDAVNFDICKFEIAKDGQFNLGTSTNPENTITTVQPINTLICNQQGLVNSTLPLHTTPAPVIPGVTCTSLEDPHITTFAQQKYDHQGVGDFWLAKTDLWDVQVHQDLDATVSAAASLNTKVGVRYMDSVWIATLANPKLTCNSANKCADYLLTGDTFPGNIKVTITQPNPKWLDVSLTVPGDVVPKVATSICNPSNAPVVGDAVITYAIDPASSYFGAGVTVPKNNMPTTFKKCTLPTSCNGVFPPGAPPKASPTAVTVVPTPTPKSYEKEPSTGNNNGTKPPADTNNVYTSAPRVSDNFTTKPKYGYQPKRPSGSPAPNPSPAAALPDNIPTAADIPSAADKAVSDANNSAITADAAASTDAEQGEFTYSSASQLHASIILLSIVIGQ